MICELYAAVCVVHHKNAVTLLLVGYNFAMGCGASALSLRPWEKMGGRAEREERSFQSAHPPMNTSQPSFERSSSSNVDWRAVARGSHSPVGRRMPGGGKLIGSSLTRGSTGLDCSGRSSSMGSSTELSTGAEPARCNGDAAAPCSTLSTLYDGAAMPHPCPPSPSGRASGSAALTHSTNAARCPELSEQKQTAIGPEGDGLHLPPGDHHLEA